MPSSVLIPGTNWHATDGAAIDNFAKVSSAAQKTAAGWTLNNQRLSVYGTTNVPLWEVPATIETTDISTDMNEDGTRIASGYSHSVEVYGTTSSMPLWSTTISMSVTGVRISGDGLKVFVAAANVPVNDSSYVYCYNVGQNTPAWTKSYPGGYASLVINKSATRVLLGVYGGGYTFVHVLNGTNGSFIFDAPTSDQYPPAISDDGKYIVNGNFSGLIGWVFFYFTDAASVGHMFKLMFGISGQAGWNIQADILLRNNLVFFAVAALAATPLAANLVKRVKLLTKPRQQMTGRPMLTALTLAMNFLLLFFCTAALVGSTYNPFLYFRF